MENKRRYKGRSFSEPNKAVETLIHSRTGYFFFLVSHGKDSKRNEGFRPFKEAFIQRTWKQSESLVLRLCPDKEFLHTKINNKDVYVDYGATKDIPEDACSLRQYG